MPAINVARTDTFEQQRVKINEIGQQIFNISSGGSDLSTGLLRLGDGTKDNPSLAFTSQTSLGIFKDGSNTFSFVGNGAKLLDVTTDSINAFKDIVVKRKVLFNQGLSIVSGGSNYDAGTYSNVNVTGGTGSLGSLIITVVEFTGVHVPGSGYTKGTYAGVVLSGGSGEDALCSFAVPGIEGSILSAGSFYKPGTYTSVPLTNGSGSSATADITITGETTYTSTVVGGSGYADASYVGVRLQNTPTTTYIVTSVANPGTPPPDNVFAINGVNQQSLTLVKGNTYKFDISDSSLNGHFFQFQMPGGNPLPPTYTFLEFGVPGTTDASVYLVISPDADTETIEYFCSVHEGMGGNISVTTGASASYGTGILASLEVSGGTVSSVIIDSVGENYQAGDVLTVYSGDLGGTGNGFSFEILSIVYTGVVSSITIVDDGTGYLFGDILSISDASVGGGGGSGFQFAVSSSPGTIPEDSFNFTSRGTGYQIGDVLTLAGPVSNLSTNINAEKTAVATTLSTLTAVITVADTTGIVAGMEVFTEDATEPGELAVDTTVLSVDSSTTLTLSANPTADGAATLSFVSVENLDSIQLTDVTGINPGFLIQKVSGSGDIVSGTEVNSVDIDNNIVVMSTNGLIAGPIVVNFVPPYGIPTSNFSFTIDNLGEIDDITVAQGGNGYSIGDLISINPQDLTQPIAYGVTNKQLLEVTFTSTYPDTTWSVGDFIKVADGVIESFEQSSLGTALTPNTVGPLATTLSTLSASVTVSSTAGIVAGMIVEQDPSDTGGLAASTTVLSVDSGTTLTLDQVPLQDGAANLTFLEDLTATYSGVSTTTSGNGVGATFDVVRGVDGEISTITIANTGTGYAISDTITILGTAVGGVSPDQDLELVVGAATITEPLEIYQINSSGGNITSLIIDFGAIQDNDTVYDHPTPGSSYQIASVGDTFSRFFINTGDGNGAQYLPNITFYSGNTYSFDLSDTSNNSHTFALSTFRDGDKSPSLVENISSTLSDGSTTITVSSSVGILPGMQVLVTGGIGTLADSTTVESVVGNTIVLSSLPTAPGAVILTFSGYEYTDGVTRTANSLVISVTDATPSPLYYYCASSGDIHNDEGGFDNAENAITVDLNNPKTFGSGAQFEVTNVNVDDVVVSDIETGKFTSVSLETTSLVAQTIDGQTSIQTPTLAADTINTDLVQTTGSELKISGTTLSVTTDLFNVGTNFSIDGVNGDTTTNGVLKTTSSINVNDSVLISGNTISTTTETLLVTPAAGKVAKINTVSALVIPTGTTLERPLQGLRENGSIRFNTDTNQYEGYADATSSWSSLGGVRDIDGNTYILAELTPGANDNTLWFYNDGINTVKFTPQFLEFAQCKKVRSLNTSAPVYVEWTSVTPVTAGDYLKYRNNIFQVVTSGTTGTSGNEPLDVTGDNFANGTATLRYFTTAVSSLSFEEISEIRVGPVSGVPMVFQGDLRITKNQISTDLTDITLKPNTGRRIICESKTHLQIPSGTNDEKSTGTAKNGSIRYNTTNQVYEGFSETTGTWGSLGGVKDVDQNTYIIPETAPGANENILYFYNDNINTINVSTTALDFANIDTVTSSGSNSLEVSAQTLTLDNASTTIDNTGSSTFISTTKDNLDLGVSSGLTNDIVLRLDDQGDVYFNTGFGSGSTSLVRVFDSELSNLEISKYRISTSSAVLTKGTTNNSAAVIYSPATELSGKVEFVAHNVTTGEKEIIEFSVIDNGSDIFYTEVGTIQTNGSIIDYTFDFNVNNAVRLNYSLADGVANANVVNVTVVSNVIKK